MAVTLGLVWSIQSASSMGPEKSISPSTLNTVQWTPLTRFKLIPTEIVSLQCSSLGTRTLEGESARVKYIEQDLQNPLHFQNFSYHSAPTTSFTSRPLYFPSPWTILMWCRYIIFPIIICNHVTLSNQFEAHLHARFLRKDRHTCWWGISRCK